MFMVLLWVFKLFCGDKFNCCLVIDSCWVEIRVNLLLLVSVFCSVLVVFVAFSELLVWLLMLLISRMLFVVILLVLSILLIIGCIVLF